MSAARRVLGLLVVAVLFFAGTACGGDDGDVETADTTTDDGGEDTTTGDDTEGTTTDDGGSGEVGDGCDIVTAEDAEEMFGEPAVQADDESPVSGFELASCLWEVEDEESFKLLQFRIFDGAQFYGEDQFSGEDGYEDIPDLGDDAFIVGLLGQSLYILDGDRTISLDVSSLNIDDPEFTDEAIRERLLELGATVLERT